MVLKRNSVERLKRELFPTELANQWDRLAQTSYEKLPEEDIVRLQWFGMYHDKPKIGTFMMRMKIPSGILSAEGLRAIGEISETYGRDQGELTTRQNFQLHYITLDKFPEILEKLKSVGLTTMGGCGDVVRNITGCPVAGVDRDEVFDVTPLVAEAAGFFYGNREYSDLPRKHKISIAACPHQCNAPEINCVALVGMVKDGREGFAVRVGGGQSSTPRLSRHLGVFITREQAMPVMRAIIDVWQGTTEYRISRVKARLKFMIDDYGPEEFRRLVEARLGFALENLAAMPLPETESDHMGIREQKQPGLNYVGFPVYLGLMSGRQMREIAALTASFGGDIRLTRRQNFIVTGIPTAQLDDVIAQVGAIGFPLECERPLRVVDRMHRRSALQLRRHSDQDQARDNHRAAGESVRRAGRRSQAESRRMPPCVRAALDRRYRVAGHDRPRTRGRAARGFRHYIARRAGQGCGDRQADYTPRAVRDGGRLRVAAVRDLPRTARRQRDVHAFLRAHRRRRPDFNRKWRRNRRRCRRRLNRV